MHGFPIDEVHIELVKRAVGTFCHEYLPRHMYNGCVNNEGINQAVEEFVGNLPGPGFPFPSPLI